MSRARCHVGTSGWSYRHWSNGRFYPRGLRPGEWLPFLAQRMDTVEVNMSFYRFPPEKLVVRWREATPARFLFALKLWRRITHEKRLIDCARELGNFLRVGETLGSQRGPLLVQLPPSMGKDVGRLDEFLETLKREQGRRRWRVAVEFRNGEWLCREVNEVLDRHRAALVLSDHRACTIAETNAGPFVYVRRHGIGGRCGGSYSDEQLAAEAGHVRRWLEEGRTVFVYFNNDIGGHAVDNAMKLREMLGYG
jgi:uncharacterized protein YecE (DUF72 family)